MYVPFWMFDGRAEGHVEYEGLISHVHTEGDYEVTTTEHYDVRRGGDIAFEKVPVDASSKMPDDHMDSIEPYNYKDLKPFSTAYLPGFLADKYDVSVADSQERADSRCTASLEAALRRTASGPYTLEMAYTLDELQRAREAGTLESLLLSVESVFTCLPAVEVNEETRRRLLNGAPTYRFPARDGRYRALCAGEFLGVCRVEKHILTVEKLFCERA